MKTNKEQIFNILQMHFPTGASGGASTKYLSELLGIQRTNVSAILNTLAAEGVVQKTNGRPVLYYAKTKKEADGNCFANLVGHNGSLVRAMQLAQAAVLYPQQSLNTFIAGPQGTGKSFLAMLMHRFAIETGTILPDAPFYTIVCAGHDGGEPALFEQLFGPDGQGGYYAAASRGVLLIDNIHLLSAQGRSVVLEHIIKKTAEDPTGARFAPLVIITCDGAHAAAVEFRKNMPVTIELPSLAERPLQERKSLIQNFLTLEAARAKRVIAINAELMRCLLLYDTDINLARLKYDIKIGCANAYVRERANAPGPMNLYMGDFDNTVRKGFLKYRARRDEVERIIPSDYTYRFSEHTFEMTAIDRDKSKDNSIYHMIDSRASQLAVQGISEHDIGLLLVAELEPLFAAYQNELTSTVLNFDHLAKLVDEKIIHIVQSFLSDSSSKLGESFPPSVFYGLCLHLDATLKNGARNTQLDPQQIQEIVKNHKGEYALCMQLAATIEKEYHTVLPVSEVVLLTMFLGLKKPIMDTEGKPVVLCALHGAGLAKALAATVNTAVKLNNVYHYEVPFEDELTSFYDGLCQTVRQIDKGSGIIVLYDMDYMSHVFSTISAETGIELRLISFPISSIAFEISRRAATEENVDALHHQTVRMLTGLFTQKPSAIVTLCVTGEGGARELKHYIEHNGNVGETKVVPLALAARDQLKDDLSALMESYTIHCVVGPHNPQLFGLPFLPVSEILATPPEELPALLQAGRSQKHPQQKAVDFDAIYDYLGEHLAHVSIPKLKKLLPIVISDINTEITQMNSDTEIGLFLHIPCCIERILAKGDIPVNLHKAQIINRHMPSYKKLVKILKPLEKSFHVIFNDDELAIILSIIYKL